MIVTALLVSHNGERWLPGVLPALVDQTRRPEQVVAVDTGSEDTSRTLLADALGAAAVVLAPASASWHQAVHLGLDQMDGPGAPTRPRHAAPTEPGSDPGEPWVWLLHDDSAPDPRALEHLVSAAERSGADVVGPKLREWPSLRRLLEIGVTISGTCRRETGLERGEYDQGQHDQSRDVLAVNTAGMLVRRSVLDRLGFDPTLAHLGTDLDFGWRVARAGFRTVVAPDAVVFHVEALSRGLRTVPGMRVGRRNRAAALYTMLVNCSLVSLPLRSVRILLGSLLRALGFLLVRAPRESWDELAALTATLARPDQVVRGRWRRRRTATVPARSVRPLLAPFWLPYRHALDFVFDVAGAAASQGRELRARRGAAHVETGPVSEETENLPGDSAWLSRMATSPVMGVFALLTVLGLWSARHVLGAGALAGGSLLPAPGSAVDWWHTYLASGHAVGSPTAAPAPPYLLPLAAVGTLLLAKAWLLVDVLFVGAVPLAGAAAYRFLRVLTRSQTARLWGGVAYGLLPVLSGAVSQGRLGTVVGMLVLPLAARSAAGLAPGADQDRRARAGWRTGLWLGLLAGFAPAAWLLAVALTLVAGAGGLLARDRAWRRPRTWTPLLVALALPLVLLLPWTVQVFTTGDPHLLLLEAGLPDLTPVSLTWEQVVTGRLGAVAAAPAWLSAGLVAAALAALLRQDRRPAVARAWLVLLVALAVTGALVQAPTSLPGSVLPIQPYQGFALLVAQAAAIAAGVLAADGISAEFSSSSFSWRQPLAAGVLGLAVLSPLAGLVWWAANGIGEPVERSRPSAVPPYMLERSGGVRPAVLVLRGRPQTGLQYAVQRGVSARIGDDAIRLATPPDPAVARLAARLVSQPTHQQVQGLADHGVAYVLAPPPVAPALAGRLDAAGGLSPAGAPPRSRAWQLDPAPHGVRLPDPAGRPWLLGVQALALAVAGVQAAPGRRRHR